jgi:hydrogenase expression/formation protein HypD
MEIEEIIKNIHVKAKKINRPLRFMELCGTHSESIAENAIKTILPKNIEMVSGPGCPVCVTDQEDVDIIFGLANLGLPIACYGDAANVFGSSGSLERARQRGADVNIVYGVEEALKLQEKKPNLIFWGVGFETTTAPSAWAIEKGLSVFSSHKIFPPAMQELLGNKKIRVDGFINPGHVSAIIGTKVYEKFKIPQVVAGFEARDVLLAIGMLLNQILAGDAKVQNEYTRLVKRDGNKKALELMKKTFDIVDVSWRGFGIIKNSGLKLKKKFENQDARLVYQKEIDKIKKGLEKRSSACRCGEVLQGIISPKKCSLFGRACSPDNPQGACMVSREGACNVEYRFSGK